MKDRILSSLEPLAFLALNSVAGMLDDEAVEIGAKLGDKLNDLIESTETEFDDYAKARLVVGLEAAIAQLKVEGVDDDFPAEAEEAPAEAPPEGGVA